ncbi:MAG TPA: MarR family transcriptional regulator [Actinoplanes sp.]
MAEPLSDTQQTCWRAFIESSWALHTRLEDDLRTVTGLSMSDYHVMVALSEAPDHRVRMGELADRLVFSPSRLTYQISTMVKRGLVARQSCPDDGRGQEAVLTAAGMAALEHAAPLHLATVRETFIDDLDDAEIATITRVFERLGPRLRSAPTASRPATPSKPTPSKPATS